MTPEEQYEEGIRRRAPITLLESLADGFKFLVAASIFAVVASALIVALMFAVMVLFTVCSYSAW